MNMNIDLSAVVAWLKSLGRPAPGRDWVLALSFALLVFVGTLGVAGYLFFGVKTGSLIEAAGTTTTQPNPVSREKMQKVLERYGERLANFDSGNFGTYQFVDPHITVKK